MNLKPSSTFAGYRIERLVGSGGMGSVYSATQAASGRRVALKLISPNLASDPVFRDRFRRESRLMAQLNHPHVVEVIEAGAAEDTLFMAMRFVDGTDLAGVIGQWGPLHPAHAADVVSQVASALDAAAALGLVHRDVKPENIMLEQRGKALHASLTDFGLSEEVSSISGLTGTGQWVGTVDYAAPEQLQAGQIDARTDVYGLGCVLFEALTASVPYPFKRDVDKVLAHLSSPAPRPSELQPTMPQELDDVVARAMCMDPAGRFASAGELGRAAEAAVVRGHPAPPPPNLKDARLAEGGDIEANAPTCG